MKKIIFAVSVMLYTGFHQATAQEVPDDIVPGTYYQDNAINNYVGTWKWTSGADTFTIALVKKKYDLDDHSRDVLSGGYRYVKNGIEIINTLNDVNKNVNNIIDNNSLASLSSGVRDGNHFLFHFIDRLKSVKNGHKLGHVNAVITPSGNTYSMTWRLVGTGLYYQGPNDPPLPQGWTVPTDMVLVKQ